ncbi:MAG: hypothetical protein SGILL_004676 [Bacillariaceae sp.]
MAGPQSTTNIPADFVCPITKQLMKEPAMSKYGNHYERSAILKHLNAGNPFCPLTGRPLRPSNLVSNKTLQWTIKCWAKANGMDRYAQESTDATTQVQSIGLVAVPPSRFICPLTQECMKDPVMTKQGVNFERKAILKWLDSAAEELCPVTHTPLYRRMLVSDSKLQWEIAQWQMKHGTVEIVENDAGEETVSSITSHMTDMSLYSKADTNSSATNSTDYPCKFSGSERVSRDMCIVTSLVRNLPTVTAESSKPMDKANLLDALDSAITCSLRV